MQENVKVPKKFLQEKGNRSKKKKLQFINEIK